MSVPKAWLMANTKPEKEKTKIGARINMSAEVAGQGMCPECQKPMGRATANNIPVYVCHPDRITVPIADEALNAQENK